jgi:hypothetical protein
MNLAPESSCRRIGRALAALGCAFAFGGALPEARANDSLNTRAGTSSNPSGEPAPHSPAQVLFEAGKEAMGRGNYDVACQKFTESLQQEAAVGTLLNLANCEERRGKLKASLRGYVQALAKLEATDPRRSFARKQAGSLALRVPKLTVALSEGVPREVRVTCNGERLTEELDTPMRFDPGRVVVVAEASGYHPRVYQLELAAGDNERLRVAVGARIAPANPVDIRPPAPKHEDSTLGYVFVGTGVASSAAAATFGVLTYTAYRTVRDQCDVDRNVCFDAEGQSAAKSGATYETLAYVFGGAGLVSLSVGSYLLLSVGEPDSSEGLLSVAAVANGIAPPRLELSGRF